ncbi:glycosyltransferase family 2 protein [Rhodovulum sp. 12E13]|uniref:glycosyltransferase family 2 protein n=1 Tax=Rhodovulum sp. 12E13 TaxID=2203891 RepID=UPI001F34D02D|nr:glycosyltransferase family 2 protein [Rhodovulum sp. 12E13]
MSLVVDHDAASAADGGKPRRRRPGAARHLRLLTEEDLAAPQPTLGTPRLHLGLPEDDAAASPMVLRAPPREAAATPAHPPRTAPAPVALPPSLPAAAPGRRGLPLGERLLRRGALAPGHLVRALALQTREDSRLGEILVAHRFASEEAVRDVLAEQWRAEPLDLATIHPDPRLVDRVGAERCLALGVVPVRRVGSVTLVATARPETFHSCRAEVEAALGPVVAALVAERAVGDTIRRLRGGALAEAAEARTPARLSCRDWQGRNTAVLTLAALAALAAAAVAAPMTTLWALTGVVMATLLATAVLKGFALGQLVRRVRAERRAGLAESGDTADTALVAPSAVIEPRLPRISMLVALFEEQGIADALIPRLERLRYPRELTDIVLLVEEGDHVTRAALEAVRLPRHMRWVTVPPGTVMTKPRALNYGLGFARGEIVGIWDAEDAPDPDQLHVVAAGFARAAPHVACLQGALDFYNARTNWLSRCFTLEYGTWFRGFLPGLQGLDLPIPLGGTTLFFRRAALEALGGWDAHNVTEDADLGIRLYRAGFRTEIVQTTTREEATCRLMPWVRQRSRWLKGYAITWAVHMRRPVRLWEEMGPRGFLGFNALFLGTLVQFVLTPVMLSFWLLSLGAIHPLAGQVPPLLGWACLALFAGTEAISLALTLIANRARERRRLWWWIPTMQAYFPLATLAAYKGLWELISRPFWWDKTEHGLHGEEEPVPRQGGEPPPRAPFRTGTVSAAGVVPAAAE